MVHILEPDSPDPKKRKLYANPNLMSWTVIVKDGVTDCKAQFGFIGDEPMLLAWTNSEYPVPIPLETMEIMLMTGWSTMPISKVKGEEEDNDK